MRQRSSTLLNGDRQSSCSEHDQQTTTSRRRVSFDLSHNVVHILPTLEECRKEASRRGHEQWERKQLSQEMLNDMIIAEIQQECTRSMTTEETSSEEEVQHHPSLKSCLKRPPPPSTTQASSSPHHHSHKKNKKKSKRSTKRTSKHHGCNTEARGQSFLPSPNMAMC